MPDTRLIILSLTPMRESGIQMLRDAGEFRMASGTDPETIRREVVDADALIIRTGGVVDAAAMDCGKNLKVVGRHGVGYDAIDIEAATERGIQVIYTPGANTQSVVEHVFAMMIGVSKHFTRMTAAVSAYDDHARARFTGRDIFGRSLGIIGFGRIGKRVGETAKAGFGMSVLYYDIIPGTAESEAKAGARRASLEEVLSTCEYVTLHVPLDRSTRGMINRETLALMRPDAVLINACRGPVVVEKDVAEALDAGKLWAYAGDVFEVEPPLPGHPLIGRPDVLLTPHSAAQTVEGLTNMAEWVARDVLAVLHGKKPESPVNNPDLVDANRRRLGLPALYPK